MDNIDIPVISLAAELGPTNAFHISRPVIRRTPPATPHRHEFLEVFWITTGCCTHFINRRTERLSPGHLCFIRPDDTHAFQNADGPPCRMVNVAFAHTTADFLQQRYGEEIGRRFFWSETEMPASMVLDQNGLDELAQLEAALDRGPRSVARIEAFLLRMITDLLAAGAEIPNTAPAWLSLVCEEMREPEALRQGVPLLVHKTGRSHEHISRSFRRYLGQTPSSWVNGLRMALAARLLVASDEPILDIALACGIDDLSYFYRLFSQVHGITPLRYRRRQRVDLVHPSIEANNVSSTITDSWLRPVSTQL